MTSPTEKVELSAEELEFFDSLDIDAAAEDPYKHPLGTFEFEIRSAKLARGKDKGDGSIPATGVVFSFVSDEGNVDRWQNLPKPGTDPGKRAKQLSFMRQFLSQIGVPSEDHAKVMKDIVTNDDDSAVCGLEVTATVVDDGSYQKLEKIRPAGTSYRRNSGTDNTASETLYRPGHSASDPDFD